MLIHFIQFYGIAVTTVLPWNCTAAPIVEGRSLLSPTIVGGLLPYRLTAS